MSYIAKFIDKDTNKTLAVTFDHELSSHLIEFVEFSDDVRVEFYEFDYANDDEDD